MRKALQVGLVSAGILLIGSSAEAAENWTSSGNVGILNGNQVYLPIQAPINLCGNAVGVLGTATAGCAGAASAVHSGGIAQNWDSSGNFGLGNGDQIAAILQVPVNVCGNAVGVLGSANAGCVGGSSAEIPGEKPMHYDGPNRTHNKKSKPKSSRHHDGDGGCDLNWSTTGNVGLLNGNQVHVPIQVPIDISGNAVGVLGSANAWSTGGSSASHC